VNKAFGVRISDAKGHDSLWTMNPDFEERFRLKMKLIRHILASISKKK